MEAVIIVDIDSKTAKLNIYDLTGNRLGTTEMVVSDIGRADKNEIPDLFSSAVEDKRNIVFKVNIGKQ